LNSSKEGRWKENKKVLKEGQEDTEEFWCVDSRWFHNNFHNFLLLTNHLLISVKYSASHLAFTFLIMSSIKWDEETIAEHDKLRGTRQKVRQNS
jgi:hypothetical protein